MKKPYTKIYITLIVALITASIAFPAAFAAQPTTQDKAMAFIQQVLPVDLAKYAVTLTQYSHMNSPFDTMPSTPDLVQFTLDSKESTLVATCLIQNNALISCHIETKKGQVISDKQYADLTDAAKTFLGKYQTYANIDTTSMIDTLANVDPAKNATITTGNTKLIISNIVNFGTEITQFTWTYTANEADYTSLQIGFQKNGAFDALYDDRAVYSIGDTTVNISSEHATEIAMKYLETYSYDMFDNVKVSGFNITEDRTTAKLVAYPINSTELRPYWNVKLYLNQTYPGSVKGFSIYVWANSGELFSCTMIAEGGVDTIDNSGVESIPPSGAVNSPPTSSDSGSSSPDILFAIAITAVAIGLTTSSAILIRKRRK